MSKFVKYFFLDSLFASGILIIAKLVGIFIALLITQTQFTISTTAGIIQLFSINIYDSSKLLLVNSISNSIFAAVVVAIGGYIIFRDVFLNKAQKNQKLLAKVIHYNLQNWIQDGDRVYPQLITWTLYFWLSTILIARDTLQGISWNFVLIFPLILAIVFTFIVFSYLDKHIELISFIRNDEKSSPKSNL